MLEKSHCNHSTKLQLLSRVYCVPREVVFLKGTCFHLQPVTYCIRDRHVLLPHSQYHTDISQIPFQKSFLPVLILNSLAEVTVFGLHLRKGGHVLRLERITKLPFFPHLSTHALHMLAWTSGHVRVLWFAATTAPLGLQLILFYI